MHNVEIVEIKTFQFKYISLYVQIFLIIALAGTGVAYFFTDKHDIIYMLAEGILGLLMLIMAYNNKIFYKRKYMTYIYLVIGVILIGSMIVDIIW
jgi:hypothetical protein